jgi:hypothetical protein
MPATLIVQVVPFRVYAPDGRHGPGINTGVRKAWNSYPMLMRLLTEEETKAAVASKCYGHSVAYMRVISGLDLVTGLVQRC